MTRPTSQRKLPPARIYTFKHGFLRLHLRRTRTQRAAMTDTVVIPLIYLLFLVVVQSAPVSPDKAAFREAAEKARTLVEKILKDLPTVHAAVVTAQGLTFDPPTADTHLQVMLMSLGIPTAPVLKPLSEHFTLDMCVTRMSSGVLLYQGLLGVLRDRLSGLTDLQADLRDLLTHIAKMRVAARISTEVSGQTLDLSSRLHGSYEVQVAAHVTLTQLRTFCHDLIRSIRATVAANGPER